MIIWWNTVVVSRKIETGHHDCPFCGRRETCALFAQFRQTRIYSVIPTGKGTRIGDYIVCDAWHRQFDSDWFTPA